MDKRMLAFLEDRNYSGKPISESEIGAANVLDILRKEQPGEYFGADDDGYRGFVAMVDEDGIQDPYRLLKNDTREEIL